MRYYTARTNPTTSTVTPNVVPSNDPVKATQCLLDILYSTRCATRQFAFQPRLASLWNLLPNVSWTEFDYAVFVYKLRLISGLPACGPLTRRDGDLLATLAATAGSGTVQATLGNFVRAHFDFKPTFVLGAKNPWSQNTDCLGVEATWGLQLNPSSMSSRSPLVRRADFKIRDERGSANLASRVISFLQSGPSAMSFLTSSADMARIPAWSVDDRVIFKIGSLFDSAVNNNASAMANGWMALRTNAPGSAEFAKDLGSLWAQYRPSDASFPGSMTVSAIKWLRGYANLKPKALGRFNNPFKGLIEKYKMHFYGDDQYGIRWDGNASVNHNTPWDNIGAPVYGLSQRMNIYTALGRKAQAAGGIASVRVTYLWGNSRPGGTEHNNDKQTWTLNAQIEMDAFKAEQDAFFAAFKAREDALAAEAAARAARRQAEQAGRAALISRVANQGNRMDVAFNKVAIKTPGFLMPSVEQPPSAVLDQVNKNVIGIDGGALDVRSDVLIGQNSFGGGSSDSTVPQDVPVTPEDPVTPDVPVTPEDPVTPDVPVTPEEVAPKSKPPIALLAAVAIGGYLLLKG